MPTLAESLTEQFYAWERRGRGWQVHDFQVRLEPAFEPFMRYLPAVAGGHDDGRHPPIWERLWTWLRSRGQRPDAPPAPTVETEHLGDDTDDEIAEIQVRLPPETEITGEFADQLLLAVASVSPKSSFELLSGADGLVLQYAVPAAQAAAVRRTLEACQGTPTLTKLGDVQSYEVLSVGWGRDLRLQGMNGGGGSPLPPP